MHSLHFIVSIGGILLMLLNVIVVVWHLLLSSHFIVTSLLWSICVGNRKGAIVLMSLWYGAHTANCLLIFFVVVKLIIISPSFLTDIAQNAWYIESSLSRRRWITNSSVVNVDVLWNIKVSSIGGIRESYAVWYVFLMCWMIYRW